MCQGASALVLSHAMTLVCIDAHSRVLFASCALCCGHQQEHSSHGSGLTAEWAHVEQRQSARVPRCVCARALPRHVLVCIDAHSRIARVMCAGCGHRQEHVLLAPRHRLEECCCVCVHAMGEPVADAEVHRSGVCPEPPFLPPKPAPPTDLSLVLAVVACRRWWPLECRASSVPVSLFV